jgi:hypothetical protein
MFGFLKRKSPRERLEAEYQRRLEEAHRLSHVDRRRSDEKAAEAEEIRLRLEAMDETAG